MSKGKSYVASFNQGTRSYVGVEPFKLLDTPNHFEWEIAFSSF